MMQTYCDLNTFLRKPLIVKGLNRIGKDGQEIQGKEFIIPGQIPIKFMMELNNYVKEQDSLSKNETAITAEEELKKIKDMVLDIINLDKAHKYTTKDIDENFDDIMVMQALIKAVINYIYEIEADPNSNSPQSK